MKLNREKRLICLLLFCLAATGCGGKSEATKFSATLQATELAREFKTDKNRAHKTYAGERARVAGKVSSIIAAPDGTFALTFRTSVYSFTPTRCHFNTTESRGLSSIKSNEEITVIGTVIGFDDAENLIVLEDCGQL